jgi:6-phosphogluconolactonase
MIEGVSFPCRVSGSPVLLFIAFKFSQESRMLQKALVLVLVFAGISGCIGCGNATSHYVYATIPAANQVIAYREDPNSGELTETTGSPYSVGDGARSVVLHPSGKYLYVANPGQNENDISLFTIASNGTLTEVPPRTSVLPDASQPELLVMDPAGNYLYVMNTATANISVFSINSDSGALTQLAGSPFRIGLTPLNMLLTPSGNYLYVSSSVPLSAGASSGSILAFSVTAGTPQLASLTSSFGINPNGLAIDPNGSYLYAANTTSNTISIFAIGASGGLTEVSGSPLDDTYSDPISLILDSTGSYLYVANQVSNNVAVYSISSTGLPVALTTSTSTFAFETETSPSFLAADPGGKYLFVGNQGSSAAGIQSFELSSGNLEPLFTYGVGNTPSSIAVLQ